MPVAETKTPPTSLELDNTDRRILVAVIKHRKQYDYGPTWTEIRERLGPEYQRSWDAFVADFERRRPYIFFAAQHPTLTPEQLEVAYRKAAWKEWDRQDQLRPRMERLKAVGYVTYSSEPKSLAPGPLLIAAQARASELTTNGNGAGKG
jgi:hypothetical protein